MNNITEIKVPAVSCFKAPITNIRPEHAADLREIAQKVRQDEQLKRLTEQYRMLTDKQARRDFKAKNFPYITPSGVFTERKAESILCHSGLICLDFDDVRNYNLLRCDLLHDKCYETAMLFRSPSGGLKWFASMNCDEDYSPDEHKRFFNEIRTHVYNEYGALADSSGSDICRACFLCHDENVFINYKFNELCK